MHKCILIELDLPENLEQDKILKVKHAIILAAGRVLREHQIGVFVVGSRVDTIKEDRGSVV